ncbi:PDZ domain-containing protein [Rhodopirellula sp. MGV]|uniref:PDZ domain-containing protein n=1 Tax=Rhodopirellula sp. MGV TaxID=2023130 RepID=UPI0013041366|nr:PDZ domain-containing protein [Rhodopirellula sp. MGV]
MFGQDESRPAEGSKPPTVGESSIGFAELAPKPRQRTLEQWAQELTSDRFRIRQAAKEALIQGGYEAVPALRQILDEGELDSTEAVVGILAKIAENEPPWKQDGAIATLEQIAGTGFGTKATIAKSVLKSFSEIRDLQARQELAKVGVFVGEETVALGARSRAQQVIRIDDGWSGDAKLLAWIRWLKGTPYVIVQGDAVRADVFESVIRLPEDMTLILIEGQLSLEAIDVLKKRDRIDAIEIRYIPLNQSLLSQLPSLGVRQALHLMGTGTKNDQLEQLRVAMPGVAVTTRSGGFLGVICRSLDQDYCEVDEVIPGSGAHQAGILAGDIVIRIDDTKISRFDDLQRQINTHVPGDEIKIQIRRFQQVISTTAVLKKLETQ